MSTNISNITKFMHVVAAVSFLGMSAQLAGAQVSINVESKILIDNLISQIDKDKDERAIVSLQRGEMMDVTSYYDKERPVISLQDNVFHFRVNNCNNIDEFDGWNFLSFPFKVNTDMDTDARSPAKNLKYAIKKNAYVAKTGDRSRCFSHVEFNLNDIYKASVSKTVDAQKHWAFEKKFKDDADYFKENRPEAHIKAVSTNSVICNVSARLCYTNGRKPSYFSGLAATGIPPLESVSAKENNFYLQTRNTLGEISKQFPKLKLKEVTPTEPYIANYISENLDNTIIVSIRDNAMGRFKGEDIAALKDLGIDLSDVAVRGAHVSILTPDQRPINITNNKGTVSVDPEAHNIPYLGVVMSAGFSHGDHSVVNVRGVNASPNYRGLNVVIIDSKGKVLSSKNFDTHTSAYRTQGLFEARVE